MIKIMFHRSINALFITINQGERYEQDFLLPLGDSSKTEASSESWAQSKNSGLKLFSFNTTVSDDCRLRRLSNDSERKLK